MSYDLTNVSIVIPNWNGKMILEKHLPVVLKHAEKAEIIIVDDASTDDSVSYLENEFPSVILIKMKKQKGFSSSVNAGVKKASRSLILLLNSDIEPEPDFLTSVFPLFKDATLFAVGLNDKSIEGHKTIMRGRGIASFKRGFYVHKRGETNQSDTAWVSGGSGVFRKEIWEKLGGLDELFNPFYWEDIDLSYRALKSGYTIRFESKAIVVHHHDKGAIKSNYSSNYIRRISFRNQLIFMWKNISDKTFLLQHSYWLPYTIFHSLVHGDIQLAFGFLLALSNIGRIIQKRRKVQSMSTVFDAQILLKD